MNTYEAKSDVDTLKASDEAKNGLKFYIPYITEKLPKLERIYLFGSQARGDWTEDSDIDLLFVFDKDYYESFASPSAISRVITSIEREFFDSYGVYVPFAEISCGRLGENFSFQDYSPLLYRAIEREGILLFCRNN